MNDWFTWNGVKCTDHHMHVLNPPSIIVPKERAEDIEIPGKSGTLTRRQGDFIHDNINLSATCIIDSLYDEDGRDIVFEIGRWLRGDGEVTFWNRPDGYYKGRIANQIPFDKILRNHPHRLFSLEFQCDPFFYLYSGTYEFELGSAGRLYNLGNIPSLPLLRVEGNGEGTIMLGTETILLEDISDLDYIMIDCDAKVAYKGERGNPNDPLMLLGSRVTGEWLSIPEGESFMTYTGGITSVIVTPRWRCV